MSTYLSRDWGQDWGSLRRFDTIVDAEPAEIDLGTATPLGAVVPGPDPDRSREAGPGHRVSRVVELRVAVRTSLFAQTPPEAWPENADLLAPTFWDRRPTSGRSRCRPGSSRSTA